MGSVEAWRTAEKAWVRRSRRLDIDWETDAGAGAFYGPKIDFQVQRCAGSRLAARYGTARLPAAGAFRAGIHRRRWRRASAGDDPPRHAGLAGAFLGILIEHTAGAFPVWLAPVQAVVLPVSEKFGDYGAAVRDRLAAAGLRAELDIRNEKLGYRIREAQVQKVPYMLVVGAREEEAGEVAVRLRTEEDLGSLPITAFLERAQDRIATKSRHL